MNNNKKYKKWSLGLVAPALVLAPIAVVASCSSSSEDTKIDLTKLVYTIALKDNNTNPQEIQLSDQNSNSVDTITNEKLIDLVLTSDNKAKILDITGADATKINDDVLKKQILSVDGDVSKDKSNGKITFTLKVSSPTNGSGEALTKEIIFTGFKKEVDTPTEYLIKFKDKESDDKYLLKTVSETAADEFSDAETEIKPLIIKEKEVIFESTKGNLPTDQEWWNSNLIISRPSVDAPNGEITVSIQLNKSDSENESQNIKAENVILKGFKPKKLVTTIKPDISTVTLGLNGDRTEAKALINEQWIFDHLNLLFDNGTDLIKNKSDIVSGSIATEDLSTGQGNPIKLKFKIAANKWYDDQGAVGKTEQEFQITINDLSNAATNGTILSNKSDASKPLSIGLVDPELAKKTFQEYLDDSANIFTKDFVFKYRKHLLTGDFTKVDQAGKDGFLKEYPEDASAGIKAGFVKVIPDDSKQTIEIKFTILKDKLETTPSDDKEYSIVFNGFKASSN